MISPYPAKVIDGDTFYWNPGVLLPDDTWVLYYDSAIWTGVTIEALLRSSGKVWMSEHQYLVDVRYKLMDAKDVYNKLLTVVSCVPLRHLPPLAATHHDPKVRDFALMRLAQGGLPRGPTVEP